VAILLRFKECEQSSAMPFSAILKLDSYQHGPELLQVSSSVDRRASVVYPDCLSAA
jgi:hypothetical protein